MTRRCVSLAVVAAVVVVAPAAAQTALPLDTVTTGQVSAAGPDEYVFDAASAGVLSVAVRGEGDDDLTLEVRDADGQRVLDGYADEDLRGSYGVERLSVVLNEAGAYRVRVAAGVAGVVDGDYQLGATWLGFPALGVPDPDGRPSAARALAVGEAVEDGLDGDAGDLWDWFVVTPDAAGVLTLVTRGTDGTPDLVLEAYAAGMFGEDDSLARSDQDQEGVLANESVSIDVTPGEAVYVKVLGFSGGAAGGYRLSSGLIP